MRIVDGQKVLQAEIEAARKLDFDGWDSYDGRNYQYYTIKWNEETDLIIIQADNSGNCYGDYHTYYFKGFKSFADWIFQKWYHVTEELGRLFGNCPEQGQEARFFDKAMAAAKGY